MKHYAVFVLALALALPLAAQTSSPGATSPATAAPATAATALADSSYGLGMFMAQSIKKAGLDITVDDFVAGLKDMLSGNATRLTEAEAEEAIQTAIAAVQAKKGDAALAEGRAFLDSNKSKPGVKVTASGLQYEVLTMGSGAMPKDSDTVTVNYEGKLLDGTVFDSSIARNEPATFALNRVIKGWTEGVQLMPVGSKFRFYVPSELAYGNQGAGDQIGPNSVLVFEIELISIGAAK